MADFAPGHGESIDQERPHAFDGITEYDNSLPRWWLWMLYISIAVAVWYVFYFHFWTGVLSRADADKYLYDKEVALKIAASQKKEYSEEELRAFSKDPERIAKGKALVPSKLCMTCHGPTMSGLIGPNLTDKFWIYGSDMKTIIESITEGRNNNIMPGRAVHKMTDEEILNVACYVADLSRHGEIPGMRPQAAREKEMPIKY